MQVLIESPPEYATHRARLESIEAEAIQGIMKLVGAPDGGPPVRVTLATEDSAQARQVSPWIAGFAYSEAGAVVIFPARNFGYPHNSLEDVFRHELTHVFISRAGGGRSVPRWFNEGLAMAAEHSWGFEDQMRFLSQIVLGRPVPLARIDLLFDGDRQAQNRAYALSGAFVRDLMDQYGDALPAAIMAGVRRGLSFQAAFADAAGRSVSDAESDFWKRQRTWTTWLPVVTSTAALWLLVTLIALWAIRRRRQKDAEIRKRWDEEEPDSQENGEPR